jgi:putative membrane protein insertion efficiency factor
MQKWKKISLFFAFIAFFSQKTLAQSDLQLVEETVLHATQTKEKVSFGFGKKQKWNPAFYVAGSLMFVYQKLISPQIYASCLYEPSCSAYSKMLISEYGLFRGTLFSADRLMRCNRMGGYDIEAHQINPNSGKVPENLLIYSGRIKEKL